MKPTCPHCGRPFADINGCISHIRAKHGAVKAKAFRRDNAPEERERSVASELIEAIEDAACGGEVSDHIAMMFPDEIAGARRAGRPRR